MLRPRSSLTSAGVLLLHSGWTCRAQELIPAVWSMCTKQVAGLEHVQEKEDKRKKQGP